MAGGKAYANDTIQIKMDTEVVDLCQDDLPYRWRNKNYTKAGKYQVSVVTPGKKPTPPATVQVDTMRIYTLDLRTYTHAVDNKTVYLCDECSFMYHGKLYTEPGVYSDTFPMPNTCDSVFRLTVLHADGWHFFDTAHICEGDTYQWHDQTLTIPGDYIDAHKTVSGLDSIYHLFLRVHIPVETFDTAYICQNDLPYRWMHNSYYESGDYTVNYRTKYHCDSICNLHLVVVPLVKPDTTIIYFCESEGYLERGMKIQKDTTILDTITAVNGCDSVIVRHFIPRPTYLIEQVVQHFAGDTVTWRGKTFVNDTVYQDSLQSIYGCDSIYQLRLITKYDVNIVKNQCLDAGSVIYHGEIPVTENITFHDSLHSSLGADSIIHTTYNLSRPFYSKDSISICENQAVPWVGHIDPNAEVYGYDEAGNPIVPNPYYMLSAVAGTPSIYYDTYHLANGCDSTYEIVVTARPHYEHDTVIVWCNDSLDAFGPFEWVDIYGNTQYWNKLNSDTILYTIKSRTQASELHQPGTEGSWYTMDGGCDSIERIHLIVTSRCSALERIPMCEGGSVTVDGKVYTQPGRYFNRLRSSLNSDLPPDVKDSTHTFEIYIVYPTETQTEIVVKESQLPYQWHDQWLRQAGDYTFHEATQHGCDSLIKLHFIVLPTVYSEVVSYDFCTGSGAQISLPSGRVIEPTGPQGDYFDTLPYNATYITYEGVETQAIGDSVLRIHITGHESYYREETATIKDGGTYVWHKNGQPVTFTEPGVYWDSCTTVHGCDSVYRLYLRGVHSWYHKDSAYVCQNELPHVWHGRDYYAEGSYFDSLPTQHGMDSVYEHQIFIYPSYRIDTTVNICVDEDLYINNKLITGSIYYDTLKTTITGCDSVYVYHIYRFSKTIIDEGPKYTVEGTDYIWRNRTCHELGSYYDTIRSIVTGCDSVIYTFELRYDRPYLHEDKVHICESEGYYDWRGRHLNTSCVIADTFRTAFLGLDSIYRLELTVSPTYYTTETQFICPGEGVNFGGQYITTPGIYTDTAYTAEHSCDSILTLILNPAPHYYFPEVITYVEDSELPIHWHGKELPGEGIYYDSLTTMAGHPCDSVYEVTVKKTQIYSFEVADSICEGDYYEWFGTKYYETGTYVQPYKTVHNVDSIYTLHLTVNPVQTTHLSEYLCAGQTYNFFGRELSEPGIYRDTLVNVHTRCDSIFELVINVYNSAATRINHILCEGESVIIGGEDITRSGIYYETLPALSNGCDSTVAHIVTVGKPFYQEEAHVINQGGSFTWHQCGTPIVLTEEGDYFDSCKTALGCDSIMKLVLRFNKEQYIFPTENVTICQSELPYIWNTYPSPRTLTAEGLYYDSCTTRTGADSIHSLYLTVLPVTRGQETLDYCDGDQAVFNGIPYTTNSIVLDTVTNSRGCDSIVTYYLHFYPKYAISRTIKLTSGETYTVKTPAGNDTILRTEGIYKFRYVSSHGCDSTETLVVTTCESPILNIIPYNMCRGDVLVVNGNKRITQSGDYDFFFRSNAGCDSIVRYVVKVNPSYEFTETATMCKNSSYTWHGHRNDTLITRQGTYYDSLKTALGCDSIYCLKLSYRRTDVIDTIISICESDLPYTYKGQMYNEEHVFYDTLANNIEGCDSVMRWNFVVNHHCSDYVQYRRCEGEYTIIDGMAINQAGTYSRHHLTADGQDSIYRFTVHDIPIYETYVSLSGCDSVVYNGKSYYARGLGQETFKVDEILKTVDGCDSIIHLELTIHMSSPVHVYSRTIADYDSVRFGPYYHNSQGSYTMRYNNIYGCDSIEILQLTVLETEYKPLEHYYLCDNDYKGIEVFGKMYYPTTEYTYIADTTWLSGRPIIRTADITVRPPFRITAFYAHEDQTVCSDYEVFFPVDISTTDPINLPDYYAVDFLTGEFEAHPLHQEGELKGKSTVEITLNGQGKYLTPGQYRYRIRFWSEACTTNDTTFSGSIRISYPSTVMESGWDDAVLLVNEQYNGGGWIFRPPYKWQVFSSQGADKTALVVSDASQPYLCSPALEKGDRITAYLYREGYDQQIPTCEYIFEPAQPVTDHPILIYPTTVQKNMPVSVKATGNGHFHLFSGMGRVCKNGAFCEGETAVQMPSQSGCYFMVAEDQDGNRKVQKIIVY